VLGHDVNIRLLWASSDDLGWRGGAAISRRSGAVHPAAL